MSWISIHVDIQSKHGYTYEIHSFSLPFVRACLEILTTLTFRTPQENHIVSVPFETIEKCFLKNMFCISRTPENNSKLNSRVDDNRKIDKTSEKLAKSLSGPLVELSN